MLAVPQLQSYLEIQWLGVKSKAKLEKAKESPKVMLKNFIHGTLKLALMPLIALVPPLADSKVLRYVPKRRWEVRSLPRNVSTTPIALMPTLRARPKFGSCTTSRC